MKSELKRFYQRATGMLRHAQPTSPSAHKGRTLVTLFIMLLTTATAWADTETVSYIDADGHEQTVDATVLTGDETVNSNGNVDLAAGWYVAKGTLNYAHCINMNGTYNFILADGATITIDGSDANHPGISAWGELNIYGQSKGTGKLIVRGTEAISCVGNVTINGGIINATSTGGDYSTGIYASSGCTINGGQVTATGGSQGYGIKTQGTISINWRKMSDYIKSNGFYGYVTIASGKTLYNGATAYSGNGVSLPSGNVTLRTFSSDDLAVNDDDTEYTIYSTDGWNLMCDALQDNDTYNRFSGKTVKLGNDISVSRMAGSDKHDFCGTFDGDEHTITLDGNSSNGCYTLFRNAVGATIRDLHVTGTITTAGKYAAGFISGMWGNVTIENCRSSVIIRSSVSGDGTHGGFVAVNNSGTLDITGCTFDGKLLTTGTTATSHCGGFVGWNVGTVAIINSLYAPAALEEGETEVQAGDSNPSATFARNTATITNSYYTRTLGDAQGKQAHSITAGENVTVTNAGTPETVYTVSGITSYGTGIKYGSNLYAGSGDEVSLTLSHGDREGYTFDGYTASAGTLSGSTLTMPDQDVTVSSALRSTHESVPVAYVDADGTLYDGDNAAQAVALDGSETSLAAGTYFVGAPEVNFDHTITLTGNVTLILKDGCEMKVGTSESRISGANGIKRNGGEQSLTIYGQTAQTGTLSVYVSGDYWNAIGPRNLTINGGNVIANAEGKGANGLRANGGGTITINRGNVNATATGSSAIGIQSTNAVTINGGTVSATGGTNGIRIDAGDVTINGGTVSATGGSGSGINCNGNTITLGWTNATDRVYISSFYNISSVTVGGAGGKCFADADGNYYGGTYTDNFSALAGKELQPATAYTLTLGSGITTTTEPLFTYSDVDYYAGTVTLGITPPAGYLFGAYTVNGAAIDGNTFTITANATVDATFTVLPWDGDGTESSPYIIYNKDQLDLLAYRVNGTHGETRQEDGYSGKYFKLNNNISYTHKADGEDGAATESNYEAIGGYYDDDDRNFCGHFDGNNKTISGIRIYKDGNDNADMCQGIFGHTGDGAVIHDLTLADARITGYNYTGGIVGCNDGTVARCHVAGDVAVCAVRSFAYYHGGIVGDNYSGTIEQCTSAATLTTADADNSYWYGGIAGSNSGTLRDNLAIGATVPAAAYNTYGAITGENDGAITGDNIGGTLQRNYYAACKVADTPNATGVGCGYIGDGNGGRIVADVTANNGAVPGYFLTLGEGITIAGGATTFTIPAHGETAEVTYHVAAAGANVTLSYSGTIGDGYQLGIVSNDGTADHALSPDGNGNYTITMPAANVTVTATVTVLPWTGDGSESSPYIIYNKDQLDLLAYRVNGTHGETLQEDGYQDTYFKLNNDISYTHTSAWNDYTSDESNFEAIGGYYGADRSFFGHFDGNSKTISGIRIYKGGSSNADNFQGIFGRTASIADIHDLTIADARITGNVFTGGIVGNNTVATVARCHVADDVAVCAVQSDVYYHGGIVGDNHGTIEQCTSAATLTIADADNSKYYGGIAGSNSGTLRDNLAIGATVPATAANSYGAITGDNNGSLQRNYYAACKVADTENATGVGCGFIDDGNGGYTAADVTDDNGAVCINTLALAANQAPDQNYWTTYYNSALGFTIDADENACAYTAEYEGGNALTLHKLGKVIPKGTAVIIVGADNSIGMTASDETVTVPTNNLDGVDVRTEKSTLGSGTFYVLSKQNDKFGFFQYNAQYMPARKAYLLIADSSAPSLTMVFDNETTEIKTTDFTDYTDKADTWYSLDGRKLDKQPTAKGIYIHNGRKEVVR